MNALHVNFIKANEVGRGISTLNIFLKKHFRDKNEINVSAYLSAPRSKELKTACASDPSRNRTSRHAVSSSPLMQASSSNWGLSMIEQEEREGEEKNPPETYTGFVLCRLDLF